MRQFACQSVRVGPPGEPIPLTGSSAGPYQQSTAQNLSISPGKILEADGTEPVASANLTFDQHVGTFPIFITCIVAV